MLKGFTQEELDKCAAECRAKYEKEEYNLMLHAAGGGVHGYTGLIRELGKIDFNFAVEMLDYSDAPATDIADITREAAQEARSNGTPVKEFAYRRLQFQQDIAEPNPLGQLGL